MNLRNGNITVGELLKNPASRHLLSAEFPQLIRHPMVRMAQGMSLKQVLGMAGNRVSRGQIDRVLSQLKEL